MNKHPMVKVVWKDPTGYDDWRAHDAPTRLFTVDTIGFLLRNDKEKVVVASSVSDEEYGDTLVLPPSVVESITRLNNGRKIRTKKA